MAAEDCARSSMSLIELHSSSITDALTEYFLTHQQQTGQTFVDKKILIGLKFNELVCCNF